MCERKPIEPPSDIRIERAIAYWDAHLAAEKITGHRVTNRRHLVTTSYLSGFGAGFDAAGKNELLTENIALHNLIHEHGILIEGEQAAAHEMHGALEFVREDPAYASLDPFTRVFVEDALKTAKGGEA
jgi:hypothetical protein